MVDAGWIMTGSWPIDTEMGSRLRAQDSAALASSIHLICLPRAEGDRSVGDWREVLADLPVRIHQWLPRLAEEGVVGADAIFACLGPALEVFSRYSRVEKASGEQVSLKEYLLYVWAAVPREALGMIFVDGRASSPREQGGGGEGYGATLSARKRACRARCHEPERSTTR
jgi:putative DNA methylase